MNTAEREATLHVHIPVQQGLITDAQLERSLEDDRWTPRSVGHLLIDLSERRPMLHPSAAGAAGREGAEEEVDRVLMAREFAGSLQDFGPRDEAQL